jgi:hypothetical protein
MLCIATWKTWAKFDRGEKAERRQSGRVKFLNAMFEATCVKVGRDAEHTGNDTELESSRQRVLQWRWVKFVKFDETAARNRCGQAASRPFKRFHRVYHHSTVSSRCRNKAALNGVISSSASWFDEKIASQKKKKKKKKTVSSGSREIRLEECD